MKALGTSSAAVVGALALLLLQSPASAQSSAAAAGTVKKPVATARDPLRTFKFYVGQIGHVGEFPGTLIDISCDNSAGPEAAKQCEHGSRYHALMTEDGVVYPLLSGSESVFRKLNDPAMTGKKVRVYGRVYPDVGMLFVSRVSLAGEHQG